MPKPLIATSEDELVPLDNFSDFITTDESSLVPLDDLDLVFPEDTPFAPAIRGAQNVKQSFNVLQAALEDVPLIGQDRAGAAADIAAAEREKLRFPADPDTIAGLQEISDSEGFLEALQNIILNPKAVGSVLQESVVSSAPSLGLAGLGALSAFTPAAPISPLLIAAGAGTGSGGVEFGQSILDFAREQGVNVLDEAELEAFFADPKVSEEAVEFARNRTIPIAGFDALSGGLAGRIAKPVRAFQRGASRLNVAGRTGIETAFQALFGGAGEAGAQIASGQEISPGEISLEAIAELIPGLGEIALGSLQQRPDAGLQERDTDAVDIDAEPITEEGEDIQIEEDESKLVPLDEEIGKQPAGRTALHPDTVKLIRTAQAKTSDVLDSIAKNTKNKGKALLIQGLRQFIKSNPGSDAIIAPQTEQQKDAAAKTVGANFEVAGQFHTQAIGGQVSNAPGSISLGRLGFNEETVIHEAIHGFTIRALPVGILTTAAKNFTPKQYAAELRKVQSDKTTTQPVKDLIDSFLLARDNLSKDPDTLGKPGGKENELSDIAEFLAEIFSNQNFQEQLKGIKVEGRKQNVFEMIVNAIREIIGSKDISNTLLEKAIQEGTAIIGQQDLAPAPKPKRPKKPGKGPPTTPEQEAAIREELEEETKPTTRAKEGAKGVTEGRAGELADRLAEEQAEREAKQPPPKTKSQIKREGKTRAGSKKKLKRRAKAEGKSVRQLQKETEEVYENPELRPHFSVVEEPLEMATTEVTAAAQAPNNTKGKTNLGNLAKAKQIIKDSDEYIYMDPEIKAEKGKFLKDFGKNKKQFIDTGKNMVMAALAMVRASNAVARSFIKKVAKGDGNKAAANEMRRWMKHVDGIKDIGTKSQIKIQALGAQLNGVLKNKGFLKGGKITLTDAELKAIWQKVRSEERVTIKGRPDLDSVANVITKMFDETRDHLNAAKLEAYMPKINAQFKLLAKARGARYAEVFRRWQDNKRKFNDLHDKSSRRGLELIGIIEFNRRDLEKMREGKPNKAATKIERELVSLYEKASPIGFVENYFPRIFETQTVFENKTRFVAQATKMYTDAKKILIKEAEAEIDALRAEDPTYDLSDQENALKKLKALDPEVQANELHKELIFTSEREGFGNSAQANFMKTRRLPADIVEKHMEFFLGTDPIKTVTEYVNRAVTKAEQTRAFGNNGELLEESQKKLVTELGLPEDQAQEFFKNIKYSAGLIQGNPNLPSGIQSVLGWFNTTMIMTLLTRAPFNALAEPLNVGIVTGSAKDSLIAMVKSVQAVFGRGNTKEWASLFESFGIIASGMDQITFTHRFNDMFDTPGRQKFANRAFQISGMSALDRASRIAAGSRGHAFLIASLRADSKLNNITLKELGITEDNKQAFKKWLLKQDTIPNVNDATMTAHDRKMTDIYTDAVHQFINITIQNPRAGDKPMLSNNPIGKIIFGLTSFSYAYQKNIIQRVGKRMRAVITGEIDNESLTAQERAAIGMISILPVITTYAGVAAISMVREGIADEDRLEELIDNGEFWKLAASRAGFFGAPDVLLQAWTGLKYRRDLTNSVVGASTGYALQSLGDISRGVQAIVEGEDTKRSNEKIFEGFYKLTIAPLTVGGTTLLPQTRFLDPAVGFFNALVTTAPKVRRSIAEELTN